MTENNRSMSLASFFALFLVSMTFLSNSSVLVMGTANDSFATQTVDIGAYSNRKCSQSIAALDWGIIESDSTKNVIIYIRNEGNTPVTLFLNTTNWRPYDASKSISLSWNYVGQKIRPGKTLQVILSLRVSNNVAGISSFSFDIILNSFSS